jgi:hypothetical protein
MNFPLSQYGELDAAPVTVSITILPDLIYVPVIYRWRNP